MGKPTIVIPFFGDQPFWGAMIYRAHAGPEPVPFKNLTEENLGNSITKALQPDIQASVKKMSEKIAGEHGSEDAAAAFNNAVGYDSMRCLICPERVAVWRVKKTNLRLSSLAATVLTDYGILTLREMKLYVHCLLPFSIPTDNSRNRHRDWYIDQGAAGPLTGVLASISDTVVKTWASTSKFTKDVSKTLHKKTIPKQDRPAPMARRETEPDQGILAGQVPAFPVQAALSYPPQHLERVAYKMAAEKLPNTKNRSRHRKTHVWSPQMQMTSIKKATTRRRTNAPVKEHGKAHEVTVETGQFAYSIMRTGFHSTFAFRDCACIVEWC